MDLRAAPIPRPGWPGVTAPLPRGAAASAATRRDAAAEARVAEAFEALIIAALLRSARTAGLGDDSLGSGPGDSALAAGGDEVRELVDRTRAELIARAAPLGVARLLAADARRSDPGAPRAGTAGTA